MNEIYRVSIINHGINNREIAILNSRDLEKLEKLYKNSKLIEIESFELILDDFEDVKQWSVFDSN